MGSGEEILEGDVAVGLADRRARRDDPAVAAALIGRSSQLALLGGAVFLMAFQMNAVAPLLPAPAGDFAVPAARDADAGALLFISLGEAGPGRGSLLAHRPLRGRKGAGKRPGI